MLATPRLLEVRGRGAIPTFAVLLEQSDLAKRRVHQPREVLRDEPQRLVQVDGARDRLADLGDELELLGVPLGVLIEAGCLDRGGDLRRRRAERLDLAPVRPPPRRAGVT